MFKFSLNWLKKFCNNISLNEVLDILDLQGFEVKGKQDCNEDTVVTIEVKANRPDMLSHIGIAREILAFKQNKIPNVDVFDTPINNERFPVNINIQDTNACRRFSAIVINNVNNKIETPEYIRKSLESLGINRVNPVVDITNYVMLELGQPMHTYDIDKIHEDGIVVNRAKESHQITTLGQKTAEVKKDNIIIRDKDDILCVAGIIGSTVSSVESDTTNIMIESANFDEVSVKLAARNMKISTPSSFRFERGVNIHDTLNILKKCADMIVEICGGTICNDVYDFYPTKREEDAINLRVSRTNKILGTSLSSESIVNYLKKYEFSCEQIDNDTLSVVYPPYRLDIFKEIDLIEEIARFHGYDNILPAMPLVHIKYNKNEIWDNSDTLRNLLIGLGFNEVISYSFIPSNTMEKLNIQKDSPIYSDILIQNPISQAYSLMRPSLVYSLVNTLAYNYSRNNFDLSLFEIGRVYFKDSNLDTGCKEIDTLGMILSGTRIQKGWNIQKDIKYTYYDLLNYLNIVFNQFGQDYSLSKVDYPFCEDNTGYDIISNGKRVGFLGELNSKIVSLIPNAKLIKDKMFYCEIFLDSLNSKVKRLSFESKYPHITRLYNLVYRKDISTDKIINTIKNSDKYIRSVIVRDIYEDKKIGNENHAVLFEVKYCSPDSTLTTEQIEGIEKLFLENLKQQFNAVLKL